MTDLFDVRIAHGAGGVLGDFNAAGVLAAADVHVATRLGALAEETRDDVLLAIALAVRAPRLGHVFVDLATIAARATVEGDQAVALDTLPWPADLDAWLAAIGSCSLVAVGEPTPHAREADPTSGGLPHTRGEADAPAPLRLVDAHLYLDRYWREELRIAADLGVFLDGGPAQAVDAALLDDGLDRLRLEGEPAGSAQVRAARAAIERRFTVVAGGPGTGKTTTVARIVALLHEQAQGGRPPLIALAAPTGKAAARLEESLHAQAPQLDTDQRDALLATSATTLHRLLGWRPDSHSRFRHHRANRLPHDVVIVDETSMVSLSLMGRLVEAVRPDARLILVGDPDQLTSIEAGAVLGDVVGPAAEPGAALPDVPLRDAVVVLDTTHRYDGAIAQLAEAIRRGDADAAIARLQATHDPSVRWIPADVEELDPSDALLAPVRDAAVAAGGAVLDAARAGDPAGALRALDAFRVLCAHRRGPTGATWWRWAIERWLTDALEGFDPRGEWYVGRPLLVTENDYSLRLYNGDTGVVIAAEEDRVVAAFERRGEAVQFSPTRLSAIDTVYAMTIHKSQGSQFRTAAVLLPGPDSPILTRELLYTAVTRASDQLIVGGGEQAIRDAIARPAARASALRGRLWRA